MAASENNIIISNRAGSRCARKICEHLSCMGERFELTDTIIEDFNNGEIFVKLSKNQRNKNIHVFAQFRDNNADARVERIRSYKLPEEETWQHLLEINCPHASLMETILMGDAIVRAGSEKIFFYAPFLPYGRQDKKDEGRVPISAKLLLNQIYSAYGRKLERILTSTLHAEQEQGFFDGPLDDVQIYSLAAAYLKQKLQLDPSNICILSPDFGGGPRVKKLQKLMPGATIAFVDKTRISHGVAKSGAIVGDVKGKIVVELDDMIDTGGSVTPIIPALQAAGAEMPVYIFVTHLVASPKWDKNEKKVVYAEDTLRKSTAKVICTDSIPRSDAYLKRNNDWLTMLSITPLYADYILCNIEGRSASDLIASYEREATAGTFRLDKYLLF